MRDMVEDDNTDGPFTIRAANPRLDPPEVIEVCHSKSAMPTRAADLYRAGYEIEVVKPRAQRRLTKRTGTRLPAQFPPADCLACCPAAGAGTCQSSRHLLPWR